MLRLSVDGERMARMRRRRPRAEVLRARRGAERVLVPPEEGGAGRELELVPADEGTSEGKVDEPDGASEGVCEESEESEALRRSVGRRKRALRGERGGAWAEEDAVRVEASLGARARLSAGADGEGTRRCSRHSRPSRRTATLAGVAAGRRRARWERRRRRVAASSAAKASVRRAASSSAAVMAARMARAEGRLSSSKTVWRDGGGTLKLEGEGEAAGAG